MDVDWNVHAKPCVFGADAPGSRFDNENRIGPGELTNLPHNGLIFTY